MSGFSEDKWQRIKFLAARLQAIKNLLESFGIEVNNQPFAEDLQPIKRQLESDFEKTLDELLKLIENSSNNGNNSEVNNH
ncbi:hypothetical protein IQ264_18880 [Phormidium sp. LEGE 05292]|uniref:hypothetical protein n=1 Tax=[Phormidium] sp. LEGE 05292 TaxID=767427 RepID=UPI00187FB55C|nr:hypothetical protein [Phormidium sp. LEGE 05292]MBE9227497.1 hypothetical protein [Phormidium sp. LEGE 05292]